MNNQKGFVFPFTILTLTIVFVLLTTLITRFEREIIMTNNVQNQFIFESLFVLAVDKKETGFAKEDKLPPSKTYMFEQGQVTISYTPYPTEFRVQFKMATNDKKKYSIYQSYPWKESIDDTLK